MTCKFVLLVLFGVLCLLYVLFYHHACCSCTPSRLSLFFTRLRRTAAPGVCRKALPMPFSTAAVALVIIITTIIIKLAMITLLLIVLSLITLIILIIAMAVALVMAATLASASALYAAKAEVISTLTTYCGLVFQH